MPSGKRYNGFTNNTNTASTTVPMLGILSATTIRPRVYEFNSGSDATPADTSAKFSWQRISSAGTTSATVTPTALDPADPASLLTHFAKTYSGQPTITASSDLLQWAQNGRANFRWVAAPDGELVITNSATAGLVLVSVVAGTAQNYAWSVHWYE